MVNISIFKLRVPTNVIVWAGRIDKTFPKTEFHMSPSYILAIRKAKNIHFQKKISEVLLIHLPMCIEGQYINKVCIHSILICVYSYLFSISFSSDMHRKYVRVEPTPRRLYAAVWRAKWWRLNLERETQDK